MRVNRNRSAVQAALAKRRKPLPQAVILVDSSEQLPWPIHTRTSDVIDFRVIDYFNLPEADLAAVLMDEASPALRELVLNPPADRETKIEALAIRECAPAVCLIERKGADFISSLTVGYRRLTDEFERMRPYGMRYLITEGGHADIIAECQSRPPGPSGRRVSHKSVFGAAIASEQRYGVHFIYAGGRAYACSHAFRAMERWCRDRHEKLKEAW